MKRFKQLLLLAICCLCSIALTAQTFAGSSVGDPIPAVGTGGAPFTPTVVTFDVTADGRINDDVAFTLEVDLVHTWSGDLYIDLTSPAGTVHTITLANGGSSDNYENVVFDDAAGENIQDAATPFADASYVAERGFMNAAFADESVTGTWTMNIYDLSGGDSGTMGVSALVVAPLVSPFVLPVENVNLAGINAVNLTLNEACTGLVIPEMVLSGDFDFDGNGISVPTSAFDVVVMDGNPANGPIVDGCGTFQYRVTVNESTGPDVNFGFIGDFDPAGGNVTISEDGPSVVSSAESFVITGNDNDGTTTIDITFVEDGFASLVIEGDRQSVGDEIDIIQVNFEGVVVYANSLQDPINGDDDLVAFRARISELEVSAGDVITLTVNEDTEDDGVVSEITLTDFVFAPVVMDGEFSVGNFVTTWGTINAEDKTPPAVVTTPADVQLLCVDFDGNNLTTLPVSVSRCYMVNAQSGATIAGSMSPALNARLRAGTTTPVLPVFSDGCAARLEICVNDVVEPTADANCDDITIVRTFTATEVAICTAAAGEGNPSVTTSFDLEFARPSLDDLDADNIEVVVNYEQCGIANPTRADYPAPRSGDFPFLAVGDRTFPLQNGQAVCNIGVTFSDGDPIVTCPFTYKFVRTYTVIDWCEPGDVRTFTQVVKVGDTTAPVFTGPRGPVNADGDIVFGTNAGNICAAFLRLDDVTAVDNCSGANVDITAVIYPNRNLSGSPIGAFTVVPGGSPELSSAIPAGRHILRYTYTDQCGNSGTEDFDFVVQDQTPPVAICENGLNISISGGANNGFAVLTPANIDNGSYDDCSGITRAIARVGADDLPIGGYRDQIVLTCDDLGTVRLGLRVTDALGNSNFCWLDVLVEDKLAPSCVAPGDVVITCDEYNTSLPADIMDATDGTLDALFGTAAGLDNCGTAITQRISGDVNSCGVGRFTRTFISTDDAGFSNTNNCIQRIRVDGVHDYRLVFPVDVSSDCAIIPDYDVVDAQELACDLITVVDNVDTLRTLDAEEECFKLRITYDVVNWCEYNTFGEPYLVPRDGDGVNNRRRQPRDLEADPLYVNVLPGVSTATTDDDRAFMTLFEDRVFSPNAPQRDQPVDDNLDGDGDDDDYGDNDADSRGFFRYVQFVKIYDEVAPVIDFDEPVGCFAGANADCSATVVLEFSALDACSDAVVSVELDADYVAGAGFVRTVLVTNNTSSDGEGNFTVNLTNIPAGEHAIRVRASDGCGNSDVQIIEFCVAADRTPTPICIQTLTVTLMDDGNGGGVAAIWASDFIASPILDCLGNPVTKYSIYRTSDTEVNGFVPVVGIVGFDDISCADRGDLSIRVYAFDDQGSTPDFCTVVVEVQDNEPWCGGSTGDLSGLVLTPADEAVEGVSMSLTGNMAMTMLTDDQGAFEFENVELGGDYTIQPAYSTPFSSRDVKTSDLVAGIAQILGTQEFDSPYDYIAADVNRDGEHDVRDIVTSSRAILGLTDGFAAGNWIFVTADADIDVSNPYAATFPEVYNVNDLNGSVRAADFIAIMMGDLVSNNGRSAQTLNADDASLEAGQTHTVVLDGAHLAGFQGTIELAAGLELVSADYAGEGGLNLNRAAEGLIAAALRSEASLTLEVRATEAGLLSEMITLSDAITVREGVAMNGMSNALNLAFTGLAQTVADNALFQNTPNPVMEVTNISFKLATAGTATLTVQDAAGRQILTRQIEANAGMNRVELMNIEATGVLTYTLTSGDFTASKKMVVVK